MTSDSNPSSQLSSCCCSCEHLTSRELQVLREVATGYTNSEIAKILHLSEHTVARHLTSMFRKTSERSRTALVNRAYRIGILSMGEQGPQETGRRCVRA